MTTESALPAGRDFRLHPHNVYPFALTFPTSQAGRTFELRVAGMSTVACGVVGAVVSFTVPAITVTSRVAGWELVDTTGTPITVLGGRFLWSVAYDASPDPLTFTITTGTVNVAVSVLPSGSQLVVQDENVTVATGVTQLDFQGAGVTSTSGAGEVVVTVPDGGANRVLKAGDTMSGTLNFTKSGDAFPWLTLDVPNRKTLWGLGGGAPAVELKIGSTATSIEINKGNLDLRYDTLSTATSDLRFFSLNGCGADHANWLIGIDVVGGRPDPAGPTAGLPARDLAVSKFTSGGGVIDGIYGLNRGGNYMPTWGFGNGAARNSHLVTIEPDSTEAALGGLLLSVSSLTTADALTLRDSALTDLFRIDPKGVLIGNHSLGNGVTFKGNASNKVVGFLNNAVSTSFAFDYSGTTLRLRNTSSGTTLFRFDYNQIYVDQDIVISTATSRVGFYGSGGSTKQTVAAAATDLASVITLANDLRTKLQNVALVA